MTLYEKGLTMAKMTKHYQQRLAEYKKLAKKADAQLRAIERVTRPGREIHYKEVVDKKTGKKKKVQITSQRVANEIERYSHLREYAYKTAQKDIKKLYGGGTRFDRTAKKNNGEYITLDVLNARINSINEFLSKPSAYLRKTKEHESYPSALKKSAKAFSDKLSKRLGEKITLSPDQIRDLMNEIKEQGMTDDYGKYEALDAIYEYQDNDQLKEVIYNVKSRDYKNRAERDAEATFLNEEFKSKGVDPATSQTLSKMIINGVDLTRFINI